MKPSIFSRIVGHGLLGSLGLGVLLGAGIKVNAQVVDRGCDQFVTSAPTFAVINGTTVNLMGLPIGGSYEANDTVVCRRDDVTVPGVTNLKMDELSLKSSAPVDFGSGLMDVFIGLDPSNPDINGTMNIKSDNTYDTTLSFLDIAIFAPAGSLTPSGPDFIKNLIASACPPAQLPLITCVRGSTTLTATNTPWKVNGNIFIPIGSEILVAPSGNKQHTVPGPLPILGASTAYAFARRLRKRCREVVKLS